MSSETHVNLKFLQIHFFEIIFDYENEDEQIRKNLLSSNVCMSVTFFAHE